MEAQLAERKRVLVVDDDPDNAEVVAELLDLEGYETKFAFDGESAIELAKNFVPGAILLDVGLPGMSGYDVARHLRQEPSLSGVLLIALTGFSGPEREQEARAAGFDHQLVKPFDSQRFKTLFAPG
jgi:CheY-like chemotaxis protein